MPDLLAAIQAKHAVIFGIPLVFYLCGGVGKLLTRRSEHIWDRQDWYLAPDASLANIAGCVGFLAEEGLKVIGKSCPPELVVQLVGGMAYLSVSLSFYLVIVAAHHRLDRPTVSADTQRWVLAGLSNVVAVCLMMAFLAFVKKGV